MKTVKRKILISRKGKDGFYHFYYKSKDVTGLWMAFFSGLSSEEEKNGVSLFLKKYSKKLEAIKNIDK